MNKSNNPTKKMTDKKIPVLFENKKNCCGCSACYAVCPVQAIIMKPDDEGFLYPEINTEKCIRCRKCMSVCAFKSDQKKKGFYTDGRDCV